MAEQGTSKPPNQPSTGLSSSPSLPNQENADPFDLLLRLPQPLWLREYQIGRIPHDIRDLTERFEVVITQASELFNGTAAEASQLYDKCFAFAPPSGINELFVQCCYCIGRWLIVREDSPLEYTGDDQPALVAIAHTICIACEAMWNNVPVKMIPLETQWSRLYFIVNHSIPKLDPRPIKVFRRQDIFYDWLPGLIVMSVDVQEDELAPEFDLCPIITKYVRFD